MYLFKRLALALFALGAISLAWAHPPAAHAEAIAFTQGFTPSFTDRIDVKALPLAQAIKTVQGNGRRTVYIVTDPDCRYCRDLEGKLSQIKNVTIYRFEYPITQLHPNAANIAKQIWCAPDRAGAWDAYAKHRSVPGNLGICANPIEANIELAARLGIQGTPALISGDGRLQAGTMSLDALEQFIDGAG